MNYMGWLCLVLVFPLMASAAGFRCEAKSGEYETLVLNYVDPQKGTRTPSKFYVAKSEKESVLRRGKAIRKINTSSGVQYWMEGNRKIDADTLWLFVAFREGKDTLEKGARVDGTLTVYKDGKGLSHALDCYRHLAE